MPFTCSYSTIAVWFGLFLKQKHKTFLSLKEASKHSTFGTSISHVKITWWFWFLIYFYL